MNNSDRTDGPGNAADRNQANTRKATDNEQDRVKGQVAQDQKEDPANAHAAKKAGR